MEMTQALHRAVQQRPEEPLTLQGERARTVAESVDRIARLAAGFRALGLTAGDRVAILALNSDRYHEVLYAVTWAAGVIVPINTRWSPNEIAHCLRESQPRLLVVDDMFAPMASALTDGGASVIHFGDEATPGVLAGYEDLIAGSAPIEDSRRGGADLFGIFYTGGTTGSPKGVMLSHDNVLTSSLGSLASGHFLQPYGRLLHAAPLFHLAGIAAWVGGNLIGSTHVFLPAFDPTAVLDAMSTHGITDVLLVPTMIQFLIDHPALPEHDLTGIAHIVYGASPISESVLDRARAAFPRARFTQAYGMTELGPVATLLLPEDHDKPELRTSGGRAAPHTEVRIVGPDDRELTRGAIGEVIVRGDNVMLGYWKQPEETSAAVRDGWLHTGDCAHMDDDGYVYIVDRLKDMIITGGENVYSAEVENALAKHPAVASCAVIGIPDEQWGERVHAVVVLHPGSTASADELSDSCRRHIAGYKVPRTVSIVEALPISSSGKILKRTLRETYVAARGS
jgi:acyl-CoA synthetase (AMP-forming)/AMP-acid ligase II